MNWRYNLESFTPMRSHFRQHLCSLLCVVTLAGDAGMFSVTTMQAEDAKTGFALRDGDTLVFVGDSITAAHGFTKFVELYTLMRYPERHVQF